MLPTYSVAYQLRVARVPAVCFLLLPSTYEEQRACLQVRAELRGVHYPSPYPYPYPYPYP